MAPARIPHAHGCQPQADQRAQHGAEHDANGYVALNPRKHLGPRAVDSAQKTLAVRQGIRRTQDDAVDGVEQHRAKSRQGAGADRQAEDAHADGGHED